MSRRRYCDSCGKPLGNTVDTCHECGGQTYRAGRSYGDASRSGLLSLLQRKQAQQLRQRVSDGVDLVFGGEA